MGFLDLSVDLGSLSRLRNSLAFLIYFGCDRTCGTIVAVVLEYIIILDFNILHLFMGQEGGEGREGNKSGKKVVNIFYDVCGVKRCKTFIKNQ